MYNDQRFDEMLFEVRVWADKLFEKYKAMRMVGREYRQEVANGEETHSGEGRDLELAGENITNAS